ncbi:hypothetical protein CJF30_00000014 [Rutstroemia sp. NJR-2017a BBW]|nr:hypothetical protein CJF30_00000014 [Rutstroemia sp. NJR-2017a BBW]
MFLHNLYPLFLLLFVRETCAQSSASLFVGSDPVVAYALDSVCHIPTRYLVACTAGADTSVCNFQQPYTLTQGPSTVEYAMTFSSTKTMSLACALSGSSSMACVATEQIVGSTPLVATTTVTGSPAATHFRPIAIVTATSNLLTYGVGATSSTVASSSSSHISSTVPTITSAPALATSAGTAPLRASSGLASAGLSANGTASAEAFTSVTWTRGSSATASASGAKSSGAGATGSSNAVKRGVNLGLVLGMVGLVGAFGF